MEAAAVKTSRTRRTLIGVALAVLAADQVTKSLVVAADPAGGGRGVVSVRLVRNTGASFGIGAGHPVLITLTVVAVLAVTTVTLVCVRNRIAALCLAAVLGGAIGNLADRLFRSPGFGRGAVVDWVHVAGYPATFNVADVAIRAGVLGAAVAFLIASSRGRRVAAGHGLSAALGRRLWASAHDAEERSAGSRSAVSRSAGSRSDDPTW